MSKPVYENRLNAVRRKMNEEGLDGLLVDKREDLCYLTGFAPEEAVCLLTPETISIFTDGRFVEYAETECTHCEVVLIERHNEYDLLNDKFKKYGISKTGYDAESLTCRQYDLIAEKLEGTLLIPQSFEMENIRSVKDDWEIETIIRSQKIVDQVFSEVLTLIKPGMTEIELAAEIEYRMKKLGSQFPAFDTIVVSGVRSSLPHGVPTSKKIQYKDPVTMDFGAVFNGYCSDITRTVFIGEASEEAKKIYEVVSEAQKAGIYSAVEGATTKDIDWAARNVVTGSGYGDFFIHGTGHGLGLNIHEKPYLSQSRQEMIMKDNMVITIEPGIYLPGRCGVRIEDDIIISGKNPVNITKSRKDLVIL